MRGRPRVFIKHELPSGVVSVCVAVIADYRRRKKEIDRGLISEELNLSYKHYNEIVDDALSCIEEDVREELISDIESGRGYAHSIIARSCGRRAYYLRKRQVIYVVAKGLNLAD